MPHEYISTHEVSDDDADALLALARDCVRAYGTPENPEFLAEARVLGGELPRNLRSAVLAGMCNEATHGVVIRGNPVRGDSLPPTPSHWRDGGAITAAEHSFILLLYSAVLGDAIGWATQQDGRIVTDVLPMPGYEDSLVSASSERELGWHTEDAFSPYRGDYVGLYCLRNPQGIPTTISYADYSQVPPGILAVLREARFHTLPDTSHGDVDGDHITKLRRKPPAAPLLGGPSGALVMCVDSDFTVAADGDKDAAAALEWLKGHLNGNVYDVTLRQGDLFFLDNREVVHGRRAFRPRYDGTDRWLKRVNVVIDLSRTRPERASAASRVIGQAQ